MEQEKKQKQSGSLHFDYKNTGLLLKYVNPHARMYGTRRTQLSAREQRLLATAVKRARFMGLLPYIAR